MANTLTPNGSIAKTMEALVEIEKTISVPDLKSLRVYMWQPIEPELPAIFNWLAPSTFQIVDQMRWRDNLSIIARLCVDHSEQDMEELMVYADAFRDVIDDAFYNFQPLDNGAKWAERLSMNMTQIEFNTIPALGVEFPLNFRMDRRIVPNA